MQKLHHISQIHDFLCISEIPYLYANTDVLNIAIFSNDNGIRITPYDNLVPNAGAFINLYITYIAAPRAT